MILQLNNIYRAQRQQLKAAQEEAQPIPSFNLLLTDGVTKITTGTIPPGNPIVLVLFSPECPYCRAEIDSIVGQIRKLADIRFYFVTPCPISEVQEFSRQHHLDEYRNIIVGMDYDNFLLRFSGTKVIPYTAVYDGNRRLKDAIFGQTNDRKIKEIAYR